MGEPRLSEAFSLIAELGIARGKAPLNALPGCWVFRLKEGWELAVNGHREARKARMHDGHEVEVLPFHAVIEWHGFPAGVINPGGGIIAAGTEANEDSLCAALKRAVEEFPDA